MARAMRSEDGGRGQSATLEAPFAQRLELQVNCNQGEISERQQSVRYLKGL
jgi:hypothetical protein